MLTDSIRFGTLRFRIQSNDRRFNQLKDRVVNKLCCYDFPLTPFHARLVIKACQNESRFVEIERSDKLTQLASQSSEARVRAVVRDNMIYVALPYEAKDALKDAIDSARFKSELSAWYLPASSASAAAIKDALMTWGIYGDEEFKNLCKQQDAAVAARESDCLLNPDGINKTLWLHQLRAYHFANSLDACMLAMGMGTGKTLTTIALIKDAKRTLVFAPKHVIPVWKSELKKHLSGKMPQVCEMNQRSVAKRIEALKKSLKIADTLNENLIVVLNYESVNSTRAAKTARKDLQDLLKSIQWNFVVYDESQRIKTPSSNTSKFCASLKKNSDKRVALTGTPFHNGSQDIYGQFRALDESIFGTSYARFKRKYFEVNHFNGIGRAINEEDLNERFYRIAFRVTSDILDLPSDHTIELKCDLEPRARKIYNDLDAEFMADVASGKLTVANGAVKLIRLLQLSGGWLQNDDEVFERISTSKAKLLQETLCDFPTDEPLLIAGYFKRDLATIHEVCQAVGRTTSEVSGSRSEHAEWARGETSTLVGQIKSVGVGIDCTRTSAMIVYSTGLVSPGDIDQLQRRILRPNQKNNVRFFYLLNRATRDVDAYHALRSKEQNIARVIMQRIMKGREQG